VLSMSVSYVCICPYLSILIYLHLCLLISTSRYLSISIYIAIFLANLTRLLYSDKDARLLAQHQLLLTCNCCATSRVPSGLLSSMIITSYEM